MKNIREEVYEAFLYEKRAEIVTLSSRFITEILDYDEVGVLTKTKGFLFWNQVKDVRIPVKVKIRRLA